MCHGPSVARGPRSLQGRSWVPGHELLAGQHEVDRWPQAAAELREVQPAHGVVEFVARRRLHLGRTAV